ncbi:exodeoxyribonuclease VII large subunit [Chromohalobacter canadensis]|uniref:Exodeoxyribonuclease 7 large subunit n=1 Tax=Chromohalobacter canadensis TaxID=141389 RepID=A0ABZ0Y9Q4_9GAMM|nr:exodeoxyribonuclease VII large subunit [Chromohalobacter canadensis]MCK0768835.1 exodeoxyribonuclease VII large subunit [Chromohalobacter canadensis]WQH08015.1 exodeoxyribonuclease VII large subunit [Chromohalobacter canadensis]
MDDTGTPNALSVSELNRQARLILERGFGECWVEGEISGVARPASGHIYFTLKDDRAQLRCAFFRNRARLMRATLKDGDRLRVRGRVSVFEPRGDYQLIVEAVQASGEGELLAAFERLKAKLSTEGVFANARPLPCPPRHLAIITSPTGAAIRDVLAVLRRRWPALEVTILPVPVQGREAPPAIIRAIAQANQRAQSPDDTVDALLVTRGGGSLEDLWAFNDEHLARAIHHSRLPIMSAVGHEVDVTLADFAADERAPTPSAAAERLVPDWHEQRAQLQAAERGLTRAMQARLERDGQRLDQTRARLRHPGERLAEQRRRLESWETRLRLAMRRRLDRERQHHETLTRRVERQDPRLAITSLQQRLTTLERQLHAALPRRLDQSRERLEALARELNAVSPLAVLGRGYSILEDDNRHIVRNAHDTQPGQTLTARLGEGRLKLEVKRRFKR